jgi:bifunctional non-homologous end joining protein LigD
VAANLPRAQALPAALEPMLPAPAAEPFDSQKHFFELEWDSLRALLFIEGGHVRVQDVYQRDVTSRFPELGQLAARLRSDGVVLDGEVVALDEAGRPDFARLQSRLAAAGGEIARMAAADPFAFLASDILYAHGQPLLAAPLSQRKSTLRRLVRPSECLFLSEYAEGEGIAFFEAARDNGLGGVSARLKAGPYLPGGRSEAWLSLRVYQVREFVIGGYTFGGPSGAKSKRGAEPVASLLVGLFDSEGDLYYVAEVPVGLAKPEATSLAETLDSLVSADSHFALPPRLQRLAYWCRPELACRLRFSSWTAEGTLRFPVFDGLRPDVPAHFCVIEGS